jgi:peptide/nickel transport system permease protein
MAANASDVTPLSVPLAAAPPVLYGRLARWRRSAGLVIPLVYLVALFFFCFLWPVVHTIPSPTVGNILDANKPPLSRGALFGTDSEGNDVFSRVLYGGRTDLEVGLAVVGIGLVVGSVIGTVAGYIGGWLDAVLMRVIDIFIAFPALVLALAVADGLGPSEMHVIWALSFFAVPAFARISRASTLALRTQRYVAAARLSGTRTMRILTGHLAPNLIPRLITFAMLGLGLVILLEGTLSFLGYGIPAPAPSWGNMIAAGENSLSTEPYLIIIPSAFLLATVMAFNVLSDSLRARWGAR